VGHKGRLSKRQMEVLEDLFSGELDEQAILAKHKLSRAVYNKWQRQPAFAEQFSLRLAAAYRACAALLARYAPLAAAKLVQLTESSSQETARKACLDIISIHKSLCNQAEGSSPQPGRSQAVDVDDSAALSPELAGRVLAALAEQDGPGADD